MSQKCPSENICSYKEGFSQGVILNTSQLRSALQVLKGQVARKPSALRVRVSCVPLAGHSCPLSWAVKGPLLLVLALCLPDWIPALFPIYTRTCWAGGRLFLYFIFPPRPFLCWGLYFEGKCQAPSVPAVAAVDLFDQAESKAQPRWFSGRHLFVLTMHVTNCFLLAVSFR